MIGLQGGFFGGGGGTPGGGGVGDSTTIFNVVSGSGNVSALVDVFTAPVDGVYLVAVCVNITAVDLTGVLAVDSDSTDLDGNPNNISIGVFNPITPIGGGDISNAPCFNVKAGTTFKLNFTYTVGGGGAAWNYRAAVVLLGKI